MEGVKPTVKPPALGVWLRSDVRRAWRPLLLALVFFLSVTVIQTQVIAQSPLMSWSEIVLLFAVLLVALALLFLLASTVRWFTTGAGEQ